MTLRFWPGEAIRADVVFTDVAGAPMPATGVTITAKRPDGTTLDATVQALPDPGAYYAIIVLASAGIWAIRAACTGPTPAAIEDRFEVATSYVL